MAILDAQQLVMGLDGNPPTFIFINTNDTVAEVVTAGYLGDGAYLSFDLSTTQMALVYTTDDGPGLYKVTKSESVFSLDPAVNGNSVTIYEPPVTDKHFAAFYGTDGKIQDLEYSASDVSKTKVVMAGAATVINHIASFDDTDGTVSCAPTIAAPRTITNFGDIEAGASGLVGKFISYPPVANSGRMVFQATNSGAATLITVTNNLHNQSTTHSIPDGGVVADTFLMTALATPDLASDLIYVDVTVGQAALAAAGSVTLRASSGSIQYKIRNIFVNSNGTNFSGGGGDRLLSITDNTTVYSLVPAASLQTLANTAWGSVGVPFPASAAINTNTAAGAAIVAKYSGGTADYTAGSVVISLILERVA